MLSMCGLFWKNLTEMDKEKLTRTIQFYITHSFFIIPGNSWKVTLETGHKQTKETLI